MQRRRTVRSLGSEVRYIAFKLGKPTVQTSIWVGVLLGVLDW